jgi:hypothetical protein
MVLVAAGACTVASAATATALTWPGGGAPAGTDRSSATAQPHAGLAVQQAGTAMSLGAYEVSAVQVRQAFARRTAAELDAKAAAKQAAAKRAKLAAARHAASSQQSSAPQSGGSQSGGSQSGSSQSGSSQSGSSQSGSSQQTAEPSGSPQQIAEQMLSQFGWSSSQFSCLDPLWQEESGWNVSAYNPGSGAFGIPQALPGSRMSSAGPDWETDAATQIRWGLEYIQGLYGSPCAAWAHEEADGWY